MSPPALSRPPATDLPLVPVTEGVPEPAVRGGALLTTLALIPVALGVGPWSLLFLLPDFLLRAVGCRGLAYLGRMGAPLSRPFLSEAAKRRVSRWPPKRFASFLGLVMLLGMAVAWAIGSVAVARGLAGVMMVLAGLEALFGFCMGCVIYNHVLCRLGLAEPCPEGKCRVSPPEREDG